MADPAGGSTHRTTASTRVINSACGSVGGMSVRDAVVAALARLDRAGDLGAVVARDDVAALAAAERIDANGSTLPLASRTITVKDWIDVAGLPCEGDHDTRSGRIPRRDATAVARLKAAGAVVVAKTQPGADHPLHGRCVHPLDPGRTPGGSSSGEGALIGRGASTLGLGSDSGGSIRLPAAWCGIVGIKPSAGLVPTTGHYPRVGDRADSRTVIGPMSSNLADASAALRLIAGPDGVDPAVAPVGRPTDGPNLVRGLRVALSVAEGQWRPDEPVRAAIASAAAALADAGAVIIDEPVPAHLDESFDITMRYWRRVGHDPSLTAADIDRQLGDWDRFARRMTLAAADFDVIMAPVTVGVAPLFRPVRADDYVFTLPWSLTGWPAISLPAGSDPATGMPIAVQVIARRWWDHVAIAVASHLETHFTRPRPTRTARK